MPRSPSKTRCLAPRDDELVDDDPGDERWPEIDDEEAQPEPGDFWLDPDLTSED